MVGSAVETKGKERKRRKKGEGIVIEGMFVEEVRKGKQGKGKGRK